MSKLPLLSGEEIMRALEKIGYIIVRQRASHFRLQNSDNPMYPVTIPDYKTVSRGLLRKILRDADVSVAEFLELL